MSRGTLCQAGLLPRATANNSCRKNIGLSKLSQDSTLDCKVPERRGILLIPRFCGLESAVLLLAISFSGISCFFSWIPLILSDSKDSK